MRKAILLAVSLLAATIAPAAAEVALPTISFIGEGRICFEVDGKPECGPTKIYYTPQRFRLEIGRSPAHTVGLYDLEKKELTAIDFAEKRYSVEPFDPKKDKFGVGFVTRPGNYTSAGEEPVGGTPTVRYTISDARDGMRSEGFFWVSADNIVRRIEVTTTGVPNMGTVVTRFDMTKLTVGRVDPKLLKLAIPSNFKKAD